MKATSLLSLSFAPLLTGSLLFACNGGDRANSGECPSDETCSPNTPAGLHFVSYGYANRLADTGPELTAVGGRQSVQLWDHSKTPDAPLSLPFAVTGGQFVGAQAASGPNITLTGLQVGANYARVADPQTQAMYDRISVGAAAVAQMRLVPWHEDVAANEAFAFVSGGKVVVELLDQQNRALVDEGLGVTGALTTTDRWDVFTAPAAAGTQTAILKAGNTAPAMATFPVVAGADRVALRNGQTQATIDLPHTVCFAAFAGQTRVVGLPWKYVLTPATVQVNAQAQPRDPSCVTFTASTPVDVSVTAQVGALSASTTVRVIAPAAKAAAASSPAAAARARRDATELTQEEAWNTAGERAQAALETEAQ